MKLTEEQKEHWRESERQNGIVRLTWQLFSMFLSDGKTPVESLRLAREAMEVWQDYDDANWMEPPDISPPDFPEQLQAYMEKIMPFITEIMKARSAPMEWPGFVIPPGPPVNAEFVPNPAAAPDPVSSDPTGTTQTKEGIDPHMERTA